MNTALTSWTLVAAKEPCQLLVILQESFNAHCATVSSDNLKAKGKSLASSGLFSQWSNAELFDLACLSQVRRFPKGTEVVRQDTSFDYLCVLTKGLCQVTKFADRTAQVRRVLNGLRADLHKLKLNYKFHHTMVDRAIVKVDEDGYFDIEGDDKPFSTVTEEEMEALSAKIELWEKRMAAIEAEGGDR